MKNEREDGNFWIAYADLMAGLLFVFVLLIGAIVVKYVLTQSDLKEIRENLNQQEKKLEQNALELKNKEEIVFKLSADLNKASDKLILANQQKNELEANATNYELLSKELNASLDNKDKQILILLAQLEKKDEEYRKLKEDFEIAKNKVEKLGSIREELSKRLQAQLDSNLTIDEKTGSISLPSEVLFDKDSYVLKAEAKVSLKKILTQYFSAILNDENISSNIENIIIEGHTDSDGSYIYNLDLSQKRAYEVMSFIYTFYKNAKLQKMLIASGKSYADPIYKNGVEDKQLSRRIEIKFSIKNDTALKEVEKFFEFR